ncbi:hypothetical protein AB0D13_13265 [Streptomyces sp. NPDC048430]|uniref:hypothetical protein n=1 Tax=Streptomyces sp. NPDC048430 TaxID=3155388 RepID=UPI0034199A45
MPLVERGPGGRRRYSPAAIRFVRLVQVLRRTGIPVEEARVQVRDPAAARRPASSRGRRGAGG